MKCTQCKENSLEPLEVEENLVAAGCDRCEGILLPLLNYRYWLETQDGAVTVEFDGDQVEDNQHAVICPKCTRFMLKYRIDVDQSNRIDFCANCGEVWLDKGEWELLKALALHDKLPHITTSKWQTQIQRQFIKDRQEQRYQGMLGETCFYKAADFKMWLDQQENKNDILNYLGL
jgi:Zn-finger nucleic acid-binding protein